MDFEKIDLTPKGQLIAFMITQAETEKDASIIRSFVDSLSEDQAKQLLALDGFTETCKIPIWDDEIGGPIRDATKKRNKKPDRYIDGRTAPRSVADDLVVLLLGASDLEGVRGLVDTYSSLDNVNPEYWKQMVSILGKPQRNLLQNDFLPILTGKATTIFTESTIKNAQVEGNELVIQTPNGTVRIIDIDQLLGGCGTSAKKLFDTARVYLTHINYYKGGDPRQTVEIKLSDYWKATKGEDTPLTADSMKDLKESIKKDLVALEKVRIDFTESTKDYARFPFISSHAIIRDRIIINFDIQAARYLISAHMGQWPTALLKHDNRNPNSYAIGAKIAVHNSMYNNETSGTNNTLSVKTLLKSAPEIPTMEDLEKRNARNWKDKIKKPLEKSLDANMNPPVCYLKKWEYRDPATGQTYTKEQAQCLTWEAYSSLMVDFIVSSEPEGQTQRRIAYSARKEEIAKDAGTQKKKRGRPKKKTGGT